MPQLLSTMVAGQLITLFAVLLFPALLLARTWSYKASLFDSEEGWPVPIHLHCSNEETKPESPGK